MADRVAGPEIERLVQLLARTAGARAAFGAARGACISSANARNCSRRSPTRCAVAHERIVVCSTCGNIDTSDPCTICRDARRDASILVVVETVADLWALERAGLLNARYHVLGGVLSPLDGVGPDDLEHREPVERVRARRGARGRFSRSTRRSTARRPRITSPMCWRPSGVKMTRLAHGVPVGGELDYLDEGTLAAALERRTAF